ncbi:MAG: undecaprenyl-diphosphate phosphatase [Actinobacteria bacterium]|nr:undecaprenyl-diphosphate phosphatase [Actinomycetota bacterium]
MLQAIVLGLVQGLTEFLPVSSSGHLTVVPYLLSWPQPPLAFNVALHFGTLLAVVAYFWGDLWYLATRSVGVGTTVDGEAARARRTVGLLAVGTLPAAVIGYLFESSFEQVFDDPRAVAGFLLVTASILWGAERLRRRRAAVLVGVRARALSPEQQAIDPGRDEGTVGWLDTIAIGFAQALAIFPGISRSGATIAMGMARGMSREGSARFSFLLSVPIILGATLAQARELLGGEAEERLFTTAEIAVGVAVAALSGYWAIRFLLRYVASDDLTGFARYVAFFAVLTFVGTLWIGPPGQV